MKTRQDYEALVKLNDNTVTVENEGEVWKKGDIVVVFPVGHVWGRMEVKEFAIVRFNNLTEEEARALVEDVSVYYETEGEDGATEVGQRLVARRKHTVDLDDILSVEQPNTLPGMTKRFFDLNTEEQLLRNGKCLKHYISDISKRTDIASRKKAIKNELSNGKKIKRILADDEVKQKFNQGARVTGIKGQVQ